MLTVQYRINLNFKKKIERIAFGVILKELPISNGHFLRKVPSEQSSHGSRLCHKASLTGSWPAG